jgi:hypothetical protein
MADHHELEPLRLRDFTTEQFETAMLTLVIHAGNSEETARVLAEHHNIKITSRQLLNWRNDYPLRYQQAHSRFAERIEGTLITRSQEVALTAQDKTLQLLHRINEDTTPQQAQQLASAAKSTAITSGVGVDKALLLQGKPTQIIGPANLDDILKARKREYATFVDSTAEELPPAPQLPSVA